MTAEEIIKVAQVAAPNRVEHDSNTITVTSTDGLDQVRFELRDDHETGWFWLASQFHRSSNAWHAGTSWVVDCEADVREWIERIEV